MEKEGKISFQDDVRKYIPELPDYGRTITINNLLHHTSGLRGFIELLIMSGIRLEDYIDQERALDIIINQKKLKINPGEKFKYCNSGYILLAEVVERITKEDFCIWTSKNIFQKLDMEDTYFYSNSEFNHKNRAISYSIIDTNEFNVEIAYTFCYGSTNLISTTIDLSIWLNFLGANKDKREFKNLLSKGILYNGDTLNFARGLVYKNHNGLYFP